VCSFWNFDAFLSFAAVRLRSSGARNAARGLGAESVFETEKTGTRKITSGRELLINPTSVRSFQRSWFAAAGVHPTTIGSIATMYRYLLTERNRPATSTRRREKSKKAFPQRRVCCKTDRCRTFRANVSFPQQMFVLRREGDGIPNLFSPQVSRPSNLLAPCEPVRVNENASCNCSTRRRPLSVIYSESSTVSGPNVGSHARRDFAVLQYCSRGSIVGVTKCVQRTQYGRQVCLLMPTYWVFLIFVVLLLADLTSANIHNVFVFALSFYNLIETKVNVR